MVEGVNDEDKLKLRIHKTGEDIETTWGDLKKGLDYFMELYRETTLREDPRRG
jgi:hypothetical protein